MPALSTKVRVRAFGGALTVSVNVHAAAGSPVRNAQVCTGPDDANPHDPVRVTTVMRCATCGDIHAGQTKKARPVGDGYIVLTEEDLAAATGDLTPFKKTMDLTAHPAAQVDALTAPGKSMNYLQPEPGFEVTYAMLAKAIVARPDLVYVTRWVPRSSLGVFTLHVLPDTDGRQVIVMRERVAGEQLKAAPDFTLPEVAAGFEAMAEQYLDVTGVTTFDMVDYRDTSEEKLAQVVAGRAGVPLQVTGTPTKVPTSADGALAALQAKIDEAKAAKAKPVRKRAPRKTAAASTSVKAAVKAPVKPAAKPAAKPRVRKTAVKPVTETA